MASVLSSQRLVMVCGVKRTKGAPQQRKNYKNFLLGLIMMMNEIMYSALVVK